MMPIKNDRKRFTEKLSYIFSVLLNNIFSKPNVPKIF